MRYIDIGEYRAQRLENLKRIAAGHGGACLSEQYIGNKAKLRWRCIEGHEWEAIPTNIARGHWCIIWWERETRTSKGSLHRYERHLVPCLRWLLPIEFGNDARSRTKARGRVPLDKVRQQQGSSSLEVC